MNFTSRAMKGANSLALAATSQVGIGSRWKVLLGNERIRERVEETETEENRGNEEGREKEETLGEKQKQ